MLDAGQVDAVASWTAVARTLHWAEPILTPYEEGGQGPAGEDSPVGGVRGRWFVGGRLNAAENCLDRHLAKRRDHIAVHWEGEPGDARSLTYGQLHDEVGAFAEALHGLGVGVGDRVALYMGWVPEAVVAMLACARLGAVHVVVPVPLPPEAVADRLADVMPKVLVTQDGAWRHGVMLPLKARADEALAAIDGVEYTIVLRRTGVDVAWYEGDRWYHEAVASPRPNQVRASVAAAPVPAEHALMLAHLSDRRGRPKAVTHATGALLTYAAGVHELALTSSEDDVLWCAVDLAWGAAQTHGVYGPLLSGATAVMFEGMLDTPTQQRAWQIVERYEVTTLMTTPSVWRSLRGWTEGPPGNQASSLRYLLSAGERLEPATRRWLEKDVAAGHAIVADAWGQTELGGAVLFRPPCGRGLPDPGLDVVDAAGITVPPGGSGELILRNPWAGLMLEVSGEEALYWHHPGVYATSDLARRETDGQITIVGRLDPVISVSGQLVSATEVRDVLAEHPLIKAAEVVGRDDPLGGESIVACVAVGPGVEVGQRLAAELCSCVHEELGGLAAPKVVAFCETLPDDQERPRIRRALTRLCAGTLDTTLVFSTAQLNAALQSSGLEMA